MDIAIYHPWIKERGGAEKVLLKYALETNHNVTIFTGFYDQERTFTGFKDIEVREIGTGREPKGFVDRLIRFELFNSVRSLDLEDFDTFLISTSGVGTSISLRNPQKNTLTYTHTPLRPAIKEFRESYLEDITPLLRPIYGAAIKFFAKLENFSYSKIDLSIANSETTKERMISRRLMHSKDIDVINPGTEMHEGGNFEKYFFYPSRFRRYKRQDLAIEAFNKADLDDFKLILAGSAQEKEYIEELREIAGENVEIKTDVPEDEWNELYRNCYSVLFMAENEDWGMIPVEAGSYGKPVIAVNEAGPTESVLHDETGFLLEPDPEKIGQKMRELSENREKTEKIGERGLKEARKYSWKNFASKIDEKIEQLVEEEEK